MYTKRTIPIEACTLSHAARKSVAYSWICRVQRVYFCVSG